MNKKQAEQLIDKYVDGTASAGERQALDASLNRHMEHSDPLRSAKELDRAARHNRKAVLAAIRDTGTHGSPIRRLTMRTLPYAAAILVAALVGYIAIVGLPPALHNPGIADIPPGGNRATLTLADGRTVDLSEAQSGIVIGAEDITYDDGASLGLPPSEELVLTTPKGGTYQVTLPDGSKVWLNAASTLKYPSQFDSDERVVELSGEAYFEVTRSLSPLEWGSEGNNEGRGMKKTKKLAQEFSGASLVPFFVKTKSQTVEVLGTEFNLSAYPDEPETKTTLVKGKVGLSLAQELSGAPLVPDKQVLLNPGDQATTHGTTIQTKKVDTEQFTAWRNGRFTFDGKPFDAVMRELERWYDIDIRYEGTVPDTEFYGDAFRSSNLSIVLGMLESAELTYRVEGRTLTIINKQQ